MVCETRLRPKQTAQEREAEVRRATERLQKGLVAGRVKAIVSRDGGVAFQGFAEQDRDGISDACAYRRILSSGSALAKAAILRAEQLAGRSIDKQAVAMGLHSHDGGKTWHKGH